MCVHALVLLCAAFWLAGDLGKCGVLQCGAESAVAASNCVPLPVCVLSFLPATEPQRICSAQAIWISTTFREC